MTQEQIIQKQFNKVIEYSQGILNPNTDNLFSEWVINKTVIIDKFLKGKYIYTYPHKVTFELNENAKQERMNSFIEYCVGFFQERYDDPFIEYLQWLNTESFYSNILTDDYYPGRGKMISKGIKVVKSFKFFITNDKLLADIQNKASELIQENKVEGYLNFSVHPLDYLSVSENTFNWRSCHALDGEYRSGNLSYMADTSTVVCYLSSGTDVKLPRFPDDVPWNNKKWRCLLFFNEGYDAMFAGRQYPFTSPGALDVVREIFINELVKEEMQWFFDLYPRKPKWSKWYNDYVEQFTYNSTQEVVDVEQDTFCVMNDQIYDIRNIVKDGKHSLQFNDLLKSSCYMRPYYMFIEKSGGIEGKFLVGKAVKCVKCGEDILQYNDNMLCSHCLETLETSYNNSRVVCDYCGSSFDVEDELWTADEQRVCPHCAGENCFSCEECHSLFWNNERYYDEQTQQSYCEYCYNELLKQREKGE